MEAIRPSGRARCFAPRERGALTAPAGQQGLARRETSAPSLTVRARPAARGPRDPSVGNHRASASLGIGGDELLADWGALTRLGTRTKES